MVEGRTLRGDLRELAPWLLVTLTLWAAVVAVRHTRVASAPQAPAWEHSFLELSQADQLRYRLVREGVLEAENRRSGSREWPEPSRLAAEGVPPFDAPDLRWSRRQHGIYVNYVGVPVVAEGTRWLVLFIEPEATAFEAKAPPAPVDEEHHTLPDGTALHVTVWTMANQGPEPTEVLAFPVSEGWVQRVSRL